MPEYAPGVTLITCTGDRPEAFRLCVQFVLRQTYHGLMQWIVVDDGAIELPSMNEIAYAFNLVHPKPSWKRDQNTLARNLLAAIPYVLYDKVIFAEDDDWYSADFVATMAAELEHVSIAGNRDAKYYHLPSRRWRVMHNQSSASLCETAIRADQLPILEAVCKEGGDLIDVRLWERAGNRSLRVGLPTGRCVGIKGLPGRPGIGVGHRPDSRPLEWRHDPDLSKLREWIGEQDVELYREFLSETTTTTGSV